MDYIMRSILLCLVGVGSVYSQLPEEQSEKYYKNLTERNWDELGKFYAPGSLNEFRRLFGVIFEIPDKDDLEDVVKVLFGKDAVVDSVKQLSDEAFFNSVMRGLFFAIGEYALMDYDSVDVIGAVGESDSLAHVVSRCYIAIDVKEPEEIDLFSMALEIMEVHSFVYIDGEWKMLLDSKTKGLAEQIRKLIEL